MTGIDFSFTYAMQCQSILNDIQKYEDLLFHKDENCIYWLVRYWCGYVLSESNKSYFCDASPLGSFFMKHFCQAKYILWNLCQANHPLDILNLSRLEIHT